MFDCGTNLTLKNQRRTSWNGFPWNKLVGKTFGIRLLGKLRNGSTQIEILYDVKYKS